VWRGNKIGVVIPAFREELHIEATLSGLPSFVDLAVVVDDASGDGTTQRVLASQDPRVRLVTHTENRGVGAAIVTGYRQAFGDGCAFVAVMAGDNQMRASDLEPLLVALEECDASYAKGNRFLHTGPERMPALRRIGSRVLSLFTRLATGLRVDDTQCGYTVLRSSAGATLPLESLWPRYGYPNHLLALLAHHGLDVVEVPVAPVYGTERSGLRAWHFFTICGLIAYHWVHLRLSKRPALRAAPERSPSA
jgi:glycosyltransferase involved in cell wall biosynthesis